jgi:Fur family peroxide stress response transcriptional regulator
MKTLKRSRQRDAILSYLQETTQHPTAEQVYEAVKKIYPQISVGTVYRNLSLLAENGQVRCLTYDPQTLHFDGNVVPHHHLYCKACKRIIDLELGDLSFLDTLAENCSHGQIESHDICFSGLCEGCKTKSES